jgi:hypothetical protein
MLAGRVRCVRQTSVRVARKGCRHDMGGHGDGMAWHSSSSSSLDAAWGSMRACMQVPLADQIPGNNIGCQCGEGVLRVDGVRCRKLWIRCKSSVQPRTSSSTTLRLLRASCHRPSPVTWPRRQWAFRLQTPLRALTETMLDAIPFVLYSIVDVIP